MKGVPSSALETEARRGATTRRCHQRDGDKKKEEIKKRRGKRLGEGEGGYSSVQALSPETMSVKAPWLREPHW